MILTKEELGFYIIDNFKTYLKEEYIIKYKTKL